jgi:DNA-binding response OmpR family regulator
MGKKDEILTCCPTCGGKLENSGTVVDLDSNHIMHKDKATFVPAQIAELLYALHKRMPAMVRKEALIAAIWGAGDEPPGGADNSLSVYVHKANQRIASLGLVIENTWGKGYALRELKKDEVAA